MNPVCSTVAFPSDPAMPQDARRAAINAWVRGQLEILTLIFRSEGRPGARDTLLWMLVKEAQSRLWDMAARRAQDHNAKIKASWALMWAWGYMSRYNLESSAVDISIPMEAETIHLYFEKHCRENPLSNLVSATEGLVFELGGNPRNSWPMKK